VKRTAEPEELMNEAEQALAYASADFSEANDLFLRLFDRLHPAPFLGKAIDLGCGPAAIPLQFARRHAKARIEALDGAPAMLALAQEAIAAAGLEGRITTRCRHLPDAELPPRSFGAVLSNSLLHHLRDPLDLWRTIRHCAAPGAVVVVMDLLRPRTPEAVEKLVTQYAADAPEVLQRDFRASLHAAYKPWEVQEQLQQTGLQTLQVEQVSDRHLAVLGTLP